jgi:hypothetical protein
MRKALMVVGMFFWMAGAVGQAGAIDKISIAIMDFKVTNFDQNEAGLFLDFLGNAFYETGVFEVLQRDKRNQLMKEIEFSLSDAADAKKTRQLGKLLSSKLLVFGSLGKMGKNVLLSITLVDVDTGRTAGAFSRTYKAIEEVFDNLPAVAGSLADAAAQSMFLKKSTILFFEDFEQKKWLETEKLSYAAGRYNIYSKDVQWYTWQPQSMDDFTIECEAQYIEGEKNDGLGIIFRVQDEKNYYLFEISHTGFYALKKDLNGTWVDIIPWTKHVSIKPDEVNLLKVSAFRNRFSVSVNNFKLKDATDNSFREGGFGFYTGQNVHAAFDNLILYQGNLVFYERFVKAGDTFAEDKIAYTANGLYNVDGKTGNTTYYSWMTESRKNLSFKADVAWRAGDPDTGYGLSFRITDANNNYSFLVTKNGHYAVLRYKNGESAYLVNFKKTRFLNADGKNVLRVECVGDTFFININENLVETITDNTFPQGKLGFVSFQGVDAGFDNVEIFSLE